MATLEEKGWRLVELLRQFQTEISGVELTAAHHEGLAMLREAGPAFMMFLLSRIVELELRLEELEGD